MRRSRRRLKPLAGGYGKFPSGLPRLPLAGFPCPRTARRRGSS